MEFVLENALSLCGTIVDVGDIESTSPTVSGEIVTLVGPDMCSLTVNGELYKIVGVIVERTDAYSPLIDWSVKLELITMIDADICSEGEELKAISDTLDTKILSVVA